jgi:exopolysaccharide biosynthesis protein
MFRRVFCGLIATLLTASGAPATVSTTRPMPGVTFERIVESDPPLKYYVVSVDLSDPRVHLKVLRGSGDAHLTPPWETRLMPVSQMAERDGTSIAVNGNLFMAGGGPWIFGRRDPYFPGNAALVCGWAMSDGEVYSPNPRDRNWPSLVVNDRGEVAIGRFRELPADAREVVSGIVQIVTDGRDTAVAETSPSSLAQPAPRTAAGIDRAGKTLILFVADGRRPDYSVGITHHRMAQEMLARGAWNAIALDGGGSTTLVMRDKQGKIQVINHPSDGHDLPIELSVERSVANALGVVIDGATTRPGQ